MAVQKDSHVKLFKNKNYLWWFIADTSTSLTGGIVGFIFPLLVLAATNSEGLATTVFSVYLAITMFLGLAGGVIIDRFDHKKLMFLGSFACFAICSVVALLLHFYGVNFYIVLLLIGLYAIQAGLVGDTSNVLLRGVVSEEELPEAMAANKARDSSVSLISGPFSGLLMTIGSVFTLAVGAVFSLISFLTTAGIKEYWKKEEKADSDKVSFKSALQALPWILSHRFQRRLELASALIAACGNTFLLLTILEITQTTHNTFLAGAADSVSGIGMLLGALVATYLVAHVRSGTLVIVMFLTMTLGLALAALIPFLWAKLILIPLALFFLPAGSSVVSSFITTIISKEKLGRYRSIEAFITFGVLCIIELAGGWTMQAWGYSTVCICLALLMLISSYFIFTLKPLVSLPKPAGWEEHIKSCGIEKF